MNLITAKCDGLMQNLKCRIYNIKESEDDE